VRFAPALIVVLLACGKPADPDPLPFAPAGPLDAPSPSQRGPFPVGVRTVTFVDTGRQGPDGGPRELVTEIWYPATQATRDGGPGVLYSVLPLFTDAQQAQIADAGVTVPTLQTDAIRDAPPASTHGPFPLVMFSHGQAAVRWQSTYLTITLASHGYVVASPDHEGGTLYDVVRGQLAPVTEGLDDRPLDIRYIVNRLSRLPAGDPLDGLIDIEHLGVAGHSFGALTAFRVTAIDDRVKAIVPQAPVSTDISFIGYSNPPHVPVVIMGGLLDQTLPYNDNVTPSWNWATKPRWLLSLETAGHFTFSDLCQFNLASLAGAVQLDIPGADVKRVLQDGCGPIAPPASVALPLIDHFAIGFFNGQLRGSPMSLDLLTQEQANTFGDGGIAAVDAEP
jgi:predicted dienelactone hydrolase